MLGAQVRYWERKRHPERYGPGDSESHQSYFVPRLSKDGQRYLLIFILTSHLLTLPLFHYLASKSFNFVDILFNWLTYDILVHEIALSIGLFGSITAKWKPLIIAIFLLMVAILCDIAVTRFWTQWNANAAVSIFMWALIALEIALAHSLAKHYKRIEEMPREPLNGPRKGNQAYHYG